MWSAGAGVAPPTHVANAVGACSEISGQRSPASSRSKRPYAVALAKGRGFSTDQYGGTVSVFELSTLQPVKRISVGDYPEGIETSADGNNVYVVNWFSNEGGTSNVPT
jgi:DNA-binding beta-propeller fold protein YncE